jgi:putative tryptophan/tyrosine transport system substrate-binding protein
MKRREFITFACAAAAWAITARAQQPMAVIGYLHSGSPSPNAHLVAAFRRGLMESGYVEGRNVMIEFRWAEGRYDELPALAAELISHRVAVIVTQGGDPPPLAAKSATSTIPIVFTCSSDPVKLGLVESLNRPGGNITGVWLYTSLLGTKRLELIRQLLPANTLITVLVNPDNPNAQTDTTELQDAARTLGQSISFVKARTEAEIDASFATFDDQRISLLVNTDPFFLARRDQIVALGHAIVFRRSMRNANLSRPAALSATERALRTGITRLVFTRRGFSRATNLPIYRLFSRQSLKWQSI